MFGHQFEQRQARLRAAIEVYADHTPVRFTSVLGVSLLMGFMGGWAILPFVIPVYIADDLFLLWSRRRMRRDGLTPALFGQVQIANVVGTLAFCAMMLFTQWQSDDPLAALCTMIVLTAAMIEMGSPRSQVNPFSWTMTLPIFVSLVLSVGMLVVQMADNTASMTLSLVILAAAAVYVALVFVQNDRTVTELERESDRARHESRAKTRFLADMSHEIRTPLQGIAGTIDLLRNERDPATIRRLGLMLGKSVDTLKRIVDDVVDLSRFDEGGMQLRPEPVDPVTLATSVMALFEADARHRKLDLRLFEAPGVPRLVMLDRVRVGQVLTNLLSNALKFTTSGSVVVTVAHCGAGKVELLLLTVQDTGPGLDAAQQESVFNLWESADNGDGSPKGRTGAGLGLPIARRLARLMGGDITVMSQPGSGSAFTLSVPLQRAVPTQEQPLIGSTVLVVDGSELGRTVLRGLLERCGARVDEAGTGAEALARIAACAHDAILLDATAPDIDAAAIMAAVRACPETGKRPPVLGLPADDTALSAAAQLDGRIARPLTPERLCAAIRAARQPRQVSEPAG